MKTQHVVYCTALIAIMFLTLETTGLGAVEMPPSGPAATSSGQTVSQATATAGDMNQEKVLTLNQCIDIALKNNPTVRASMFGVDVNQSSVSEARSSYYPQLSASASYARVHPQPNTVVFNTPAEFDQYLTGFTLNQTIVDFG